MAVENFDPGETTKRVGRQRYIDGQTDRQTNSHSGQVSHSLGMRREKSGSSSQCKSSVLSMAVDMRAV